MTSVWSLSRIHAPRIHFTRLRLPNGEPSIFVSPPSPSNQRFQFTMQYRMPWHVRYEALDCWEVLERHETQLWWAVADTYGLGMICPECIHGFCSGARQTAERNAEKSRETYARYAAQEAIDADEFRRRPRRQNDQQRRPAATVALQDPAKLHAASLLGVSLSDGRDVILRAFKKAALVAHPDRGGTDERMREVLRAREALLG